MKNLISFLLFSLFVVNISNAQMGQALHLDGVNDFVTIPDLDGANDFNTTEDFTVEFWVKPDTIQVDLQNNDNDMVEKWVGGTGYPYVIRYINQNSIHNGKVSAAQWDGSTSSGMQSIATINDGNWHHIAFLRDAGMIYLYIDGALQGSVVDNSNGNTNSGSALYLGRRGNNAPFDNFFKGEMDELRIWNFGRSALDIQATMNCELVGDEAGLVAYYQFNEGDGGGNNAGVTTLPDLSTNANNGTLSNLALTGTESNWIAAGAVEAGDICGVSIPTMGQWTLLIFGLIVLTLGVVFVWNKQAAQVKA